MTGSILRLLVVGMTGSGKTYWTDGVIVRPRPRVAVWDPHKKYSVGYFDNVSEVPSNAQRWGICPKALTRQEYREKFIAFSERVMKDRIPVVVIDEIMLLVLMGCEEAVLILITQAQNYGCSVVIVGQRAFMVPPTARSQISHIISFQQCNDDDIRCMQKMTGDEEGKIFNSKLKTLPRGAHVIGIVRSL